jgi:hypothetical protein
MQDDVILSTSDNVSGLCAHTGCVCAVAAGETYCCEYCAAADSAEDALEHGCGCGHPECDAG